MGQRVSRHSAYYIAYLLSEQFTRPNAAEADNVLGFKVIIAPVKPTFKHNFVTFLGSGL